MNCGAPSFFLEPTTWTFLFGMVVAFSISIVTIIINARRR